MLVDMHAHVIPGALDPVGKRDDHKGPRVGPCDDPHARAERVEHHRDLRRQIAAHLVQDRPRVQVQVLG